MEMNHFFPCNRYFSTIPLIFLLVPIWTNYVIEKLMQVELLATAPSIPSRWAHLATGPLQSFAELTQDSTVSWKRALRWILFISYSVFHKFIFDNVEHRVSIILVYIDTSNGGCAKATFDFGAAAVSRSYEIKVTLVSSYKPQMST